MKIVNFERRPGSHKDKVMGCTPLYAAPEVVTGLMTADAAVMRPSMDTYAVGLVALQVLDLADEPRTARFAVSRLRWAKHKVGTHTYMYMPSVYKPKKRVVATFAPLSSPTGKSGVPYTTSEWVDAMRNCTRTTTCTP